MEHQHETENLLAMSTDTNELEQTYELVSVAPDGLGYGEGQISTAARIESGEITKQDLETARTILRTSPNIFVPVDSDALDDGCGDGRGVVRVLRRNEATGEIEELNASRRRAKLFGGGLMVAASMWRAVTGAPKHGETVLGDREFMASKLQAMGIEHGAHTDVHAHGDNCGCGAIDKYDKATLNVTAFKNQIMANIRALYGASYENNLDAINAVFTTYAELGRDQQYMSNAKGRQTMDLIQNDGAVVKELEATHLEGLVVLNDVEGVTVDQRAFDAELRAAGVESEIQLFVVDTWRGRMYADAVAQIAVDTLPGADYEQARQTAYADFLIRTLAVAATLTAGDQPVEANLREGREDFALAA